MTRGGWRLPVLRPLITGIFVVAAACLSLAGAQQTALTPVLPLIDGSVRFAVIGDMGTGGPRQLDIARTMTAIRTRFPFTFVLTVGDNIYGGRGPSDYQKKFVRPYKALLDAGVVFRGTLGNHDRMSPMFSEHFNTNGQRYYTFTHGPVQFFALDSTAMTAVQMKWLEQQLQESQALWKVAYFHHPLYSSGRRHGPELPLRKALEPILLAHGVQVVFAGHEHFYERLTPQNGIQHFITGAGGQLRKGNIRVQTQTAAGFDRDNSFMLVEVTDESMWFESVSRPGDIIDAGVIDRKTGIRTTP